jgi:hypothetical protein
LRKGVTNGTVDEAWIKDRYEKVTGFKWPTDMDPGGLPPGPGQEPGEEDPPQKPGPGGDEPPVVKPGPQPGDDGYGSPGPQGGPRGGTDFNSPPTTSAGEGRTWVFARGGWGGSWTSVDDNWSPPPNPPNIDHPMSYRTSDGTSWPPTKTVVENKSDDKSEYGGIRKMGADNRPTPKKPRHIV